MRVITLTSDWHAARKAARASFSSPAVRHAPRQQREAVNKYDLLFPKVGFIVTNLRWRSKRVAEFCNKRGTAERWIKEGKQAVNWTRLSCHDFRDSEVRKRHPTQSGGVLGPLMGTETVGGGENLHGTGLVIPFWTRGGPRWASIWEIPVEGNEPCVTRAASSWTAASFFSLWLPPAPFA